MAQTAVLTQADGEEGISSRGGRRRQRKQGELEYVRPPIDSGLPSDGEFARTYDLPIVQVVQPPEGKEWRGYVDDGVAVNSENEEISLDGLPTPEAKRKITGWLEAKDRLWTNNGRLTHPPAPRPVDQHEDAPSTSPRC